VSENIHPVFDRMVQRVERQTAWGFKSAVFWFTGLSGSGKSTIAQGVERKLFEEELWPQMLDGDNIRTGISSNLGFSQEDRKENIRRIAEVAKLMCDTNLIVLASFISPTIAIRKMARDIIGQDDFHEIYINAPLSVCEERDVKGLYKKARSGEIENFTGIDAPYEAPESPALEIKTDERSLEESVDMVVKYIQKQVA
jgi:adenylylsulfate kinase